MINSKIFWCGRLGELGELAVISDGRRLLCSAATHPPPEVSTTNYYIMSGFFVFIALDSLHSPEPSIPSTVRLTSEPTFRSLLSPPFRPRSSSLFRSVPPYVIQSPVFALSFFPLLHIVYIALFLFHRFPGSIFILLAYYLSQFRVIRGKRQVNSTKYNLLWCSCCEHIALKRISCGARRTRYFCVGHLFATTDRSDTMRRDGYIRPE